MKRPPAPRLVTVAIFTTITVIFWIFFSVYTVLIKTPDIKVPSELLEPIDPTLDLESLQDVSTKIHFEESDVESLPTIILTPTLQPTPTSTTSATISTKRPAETTPADTEV